jgi:hypothetical protein
MLDALEKLFFIGGGALELLCGFRDPLFILTEHNFQGLN